MQGYYLYWVFIIHGLTAFLIDYVLIGTFSFAESSFSYTVFNQNIYFFNLSILWFLICFILFLSILSTAYKLYIILPKNLDELYYKTWTMRNILFLFMYYSFLIFFCISLFWHSSYHSVWFLKILFYIVVFVHIIMIIYIFTILILLLIYKCLGIKTDNIWRIVQRNFFLCDKLVNESKNIILIVIDYIYNYIKSKIFCEKINVLWSLINNLLFVGFIFDSGSNYSQSWFKYFFLTWNSFFWTKGTIVLIEYWTGLYLSTKIISFVI